MPTPIQDVNPGDVLIRSVEDSVGRVLIYAGERLDEKLIAILKRRGFLELEVRRTKFKDVDEIEDSIFENLNQRAEIDIDIQKLRDEIDQRFHNVSEDNHPMQVIRLVVHKVLVNRLANKRNI